MSVTGIYLFFFLKGKGKRGIQGEGEEEVQGERVAGHNGEERGREEKRRM